MASADDKANRRSGMNLRFAEKLLDRIAELSARDAERLMNYLEEQQHMSINGKERQRALRERRQAEGLKRHSVWLNQQDAESLRGKYPGARGGIDWDELIRDALEKNPDRRG